MAIARISSSGTVYDEGWGTYNTTTSSPTAASISVTAGDFLLCQMQGYRDAGGAAVTFPHVPVDSQGNTWTLADSKFEASNEMMLAEFYAYASATGTLTVNVRAQYDGVSTIFAVQNYSGVAATSVIDNVGAGLNSTSVDTSVVTSEAMSATASAAGYLLSAALAFRAPANWNYTASGTPSPTNNLLRNGNGVNNQAQGRADFSVSTGSGTQTITFGYTSIAFTPALGIAIVYKAAASASITKTPAQASLTLAGLGVGNFTKVIIRELLVNRSGQPISSGSGFSVLVWYANKPSGAPGASLNAQTTDVAGSTSWSISSGTLNRNDPVYFVAFQGDPPSAYTTGLVTPSYE